MAFGKTTRKVMASGTGDGRVLSLPVQWARFLGLVPHTEVDVYYDDVLIVVPRKSAQAERLLKAMSEDK